MYSYNLVDRGDSTAFPLLVGPQSKWCNLLKLRSVGRYNVRLVRLSAITDASSVQMRHALHRQTETAAGSEEAFVTNTHRGPSPKGFLYSVVHTSKLDVILLFLVLYLGQGLHISFD